VTSLPFAIPRSDGVHPHAFAVIPQQNRLATGLGVGVPDTFEKVPCPSELVPSSITGFTEGISFAPTLFS
jgi:hypothetical protein